MAQDTEFEISLASTLRAEALFDQLDGLGPDVSSKEDDLLQPWLYDAPSDRNSYRRKALQDRRKGEFR